MRETLYSLFLFFSLHGAIWAQVDTLFWFAAPEVSIHNNNFDRPIVLRISALDEESEVIIDQPAEPSFIPIAATIAAGQTSTVDLSPWINQIENKPANAVLNYGLRIRATAPVTAYYEVVSSFCNCNPEIFALKGKNAMGTTFYIPGQHFLNNSGAYNPTPYSAFDIVASEDNTLVTITTTQNIVGHAASIPFTINLNKGQTYSATASSQIAAQHLHGSYVVSDKPIAITVKDDLLAGSPFGGCADLAGDQNIPLNIVGKDYIAVRGFLNAPFDQLFILATENNTIISANGAQLITLNQGESYNYAMGNTESVYITATNPIYVTQLSGFGCEVGISILPPIICTGSKRVSFARSTSESLFLILLVPDGGEGNFTLNGNSGVINATDFAYVPGTNNAWRFAKLTIPTSTVAAGGSGVVVNSTDYFHLGIIHGSGTGGCRYGFFSDFSYLSYEISTTAGTICEGENIVLSSNELEGATYQWTGPAGFLAQGQYVVLEDLGVNNSGYYFVSGNLPDACELLADSIFIEVHVAPSPMGLVYQDMCDGETLTISFETNWHGVEGGTNNIQFGDAAGNINQNANAPLVHNYGAPGQYTIILSASTPAGCTNTAKITAEISETPTIQVSSNSYCSNLVDFEVQIDMGATNAELTHFYWLVNGDSISNQLQPTVEVNLETGFYDGLFGLTNSLGCHFTIDFTYFVDEALMIDDFTLPNIITPNNDGMNDRFLVNDVFNDCVPYTIEFFNRWGQKIYEMTSNNNAFRGIDSEGNFVSEGVYFFMLKSSLINSHGFLHVIRD